MLGRAVVGRPCLTARLSLLSICVFHSSAPQGCTSFGINASPGVVVDVAHRPPAKKNPSGFSKWPLDPGLEVSLRMRAASSSTNDQKVSTAAVAWEEDSRSRQVSHQSLTCTDSQPQPCQSPLLSGKAHDGSVQTQYPHRQYRDPRGLCRPGI